MHTTTKFSTRVTTNSRAYTVSFLVEHEGSNGPPGVGTVTGLSTNTDGGTTPTELILSSRDGTRRHRHGRVSGGSVEMGITEVVDGGNNQPMVFLISLPG